MRAVFVQLQCVPGKTYEVADVIYKKEIVSEMYSTSGDYDLLIKVYVDEEQDIGKFINDNIATVPGIIRSLTTLAARSPTTIPGASITWRWNSCTRRCGSASCPARPKSTLTATA